MFKNANISSFIKYCKSWVLSVLPLLLTISSEFIILDKFDNKVVLFEIGYISITNLNIALLIPLILCFIYYKLSELFMEEF